MPYTKKEKFEPINDNLWRRGESFEIIEQIPQLDKATEDQYLIRLIDGEELIVWESEIYDIT